MNEFKGIPILTYDECPHKDESRRPIPWSSGTFIQYKEWILDTTLAHSDSSIKYSDKGLICSLNTDDLMIGGRYHEVLWHEYAHILANCKGWHGEQWQDACRYLGRDYLIKTAIIPHDLMARFRDDFKLYSQWLQTGMVDGELNIVPVQPVPAWATET